MEISFRHKTQTGYRELPGVTRRVQVTAETVVPDTEEDVGSIASVRSMLLLKSKDVSAHGVTVTGELHVCLLCITEGEQRVSPVRARREFTIEYELEGLQSETQAQIRLAVGSTETRVLNPRKLAVTAEIVGELLCYQREELPLETEQPESAPGLLHCLREKTAFSLVNAVCEKTFALNEQFRFPEEKGVPSELCGQSVRFEVDDAQQVGSRAVVKGTVQIELCYLTQTEPYPLTAQFSAPFSQLVDTGAELCDNAAVSVELTSAYYELVDTISGEKAMDTELHAVLQLVGRAERELMLLDDAYSNRCPSACSFHTVTASRVSQMLRERLNAEETVEIAEDCGDVLCVLPAQPSLIQSSSGLGGTVALDVLYRSKGGALSAVHRTLPLEEKPLPEAMRLWEARLSQMELRSEGSALRCRLGVDALLQRVESVELQELASVTLEEEAPYDQQSFPSVTLVRESPDTLWELAKRYHSSTELIEAANAAYKDAAARVLLIPRE